MLLITQGPLGVATPVRRYEPARPARAVAQPDQSDAAGFETTGESGHFDQPIHHSLPQENQAFPEIVAPATLLDTSLLAAELSAFETYAQPSPSSRMTPWEPPGSTLSLRDRTA